MHPIRLFCAALAIAAAAKAAPAGRSMPLVFTANHGQAHRDARFVAKTPRLNAYFTGRETILETAGAALRIEFVGAPGTAQFEAERSGSGVANFLIGPEDDWKTGVPLLDSIAGRGVYPGIDVVYSANGADLKMEYIVAPGHDPARIRLRYAGADRLAVEADGSLAITLGRHSLRESAPVIYQDRAGARVAVEGAFRLEGDVVSFAVGSYDPVLPLVIDPVVYYLTLLGGSGTDAAMSLAVDKTGAAYIAGFTSSYDLPATNPEQGSNGGGNDAFVAKLAADGKSLVYCTYIGGRGDDRAYGIAVDASGAAYVAGSTTSANFPVRGALQSKLAGSKNAFVLKLAPAGNALVYSTYLGGAGSDAAAAIAVDTAGNAYVAGDTTSTAFPATAFQKTNRGAPDGFVAKLAAAGNTLVYSTYLGGSGEDHVYAIAVDNAGAAVVTGSTYSPDFPVANAYQPNLGGGQDAFVAKLSADGKSLAFATYLGGSGGMMGAPETGRAIALDASGNVYAAGETGSVNFPIRGAAQSVNAGWQDGFVSKFGPSGALVYSTYVGGVNLDAINAVAVDASGCAYVAGQTTSPTLASVLVSQSAPTGVYDAFAIKLSAAGDAVAGLSYFGGVGADTVTALALDSAGNAYLAGWTQSPNFAVVNGFQTVNGGNYSAFVGKLSFAAAGVAVTVSPLAATLSAWQTRQFTATVSNTANIATTWSISPVVGSISNAGLYTAPANISAQQTVAVKATSVADPSKSATATITLLPGQAPAVAAHVAPLTANLYPGDTQQFSATVDNASNQAVSWSISPPGVGSITAAGLYTAPASVTNPQSVVVTAVPAADGSKSASANITLLPQLPNIAVGKTASQSSTVSPASRAVDGNTDGAFFNGSVAHTEYDANAWWQVDLGASYTISSIRLWNRTECCGERLNDYWIFVSDAPFAATDTPATLARRALTWASHQTSIPQPSASVSPNARGRYVRVQLSGTNNLQLAEVQVFGSPVAVTVSPVWAALAGSATQQFTANTSAAWSVMPDLGSISPAGLYTAPVSVPLPQTVLVLATSIADPSKSATAAVALQMTGAAMNLALGKRASQSSTLGTGAAAAVDGNTDGNYFNASVSQTFPEAGAWWQVDLGATASIASLAIWNRTDCCGARLNDFWVFVSDTPFAAGDTPATLQNRAGTWSSHQTTTPDPSLTIPVGAHGRYVRIQLTGTNALHMAEVQITGAWVADDIAIGKSATESHVWSPASRAVDGNIDGYFPNGSVSHTTEDANAWWQVDLGAPAGVGAVAVWNRTDCCGSRLSDYWVFVSDTPFSPTDTPATLQGRSGTWSSHQTSAPNPVTMIPAGVQGRYVRVQLSGTNTLHMAEVEVFGAFR